MTNDIEVKLCLADIIKKYGNADCDIFEQKFDDFLISIEKIMTRKEVHVMILAIKNNDLSNENDDYLSNIIADLNGYTAKIVYKFKDDPELDPQALLYFVRMGTWRN